MKTKIKQLFIATMCFYMGFIFITGCGSKKNEDSLERHNRLNIDWKTVVQNVKKAEISQYGWYVDEENLLSEATETESISFCNYDLVNNDFKSVDFQLLIEYGLADTYEAGSNATYNVLAITISIVDNNSDNNYSGTYDEDGNLLGEEGKWFISDDKDSYIENCIKNIKATIGGEKNNVEEQDITGQCNGKKFVIGSNKFRRIKKIYG